MGVLAVAVTPGTAVAVLGSGVGLESVAVEVMEVTGICEVQAIRNDAIQEKRTNKI
jgi:hypothetical protein